jgi:hypothetical protein
MLESSKTILIDIISLPCGEQLLMCIYVFIFTVALNVSVGELRKAK